MYIQMLGVPIGTYAAFLAATLAIAVIPGPDHAYLGAVALRDGRRAGIIAALGMALSMTVHTLLAVTGVGAALAAVPAALDAIRIVGAAYLLHLGVGTLRGTSHAAAAQPLPADRVFGRAIIVNLANPKIVLFFLAYLPQFVIAGTDSTSVQLLVLGLSFVLIGLIVDVVYAIAGGLAGRLLAARGTGAQTLTTISGIVYLVLAAAVLATLAVDATDWRAA